MIFGPAPDSRKLPLSRIGQGEPHFCAYSVTRWASMGLMVWTLMTAARTPWASRSFAASRASLTIRPVAKTATSPPSRRTLALPISKGCSSSKTGVARRARRRYTGPSISAAAKTALRASLASAGQMTVMPGMARMRAMSSMHWWLAPSSPTETPAWVMASFTFRWG